MLTFILLVLYGCYNCANKVILVRPESISYVVSMTLSDSVSMLGNNVVYN